MQAGGETRYNIPAVLAVLRGRLDDLAKLMDAEPGLVKQSFPQLDCGQTGGRSLLLQGGTLLHVAGEYGNVAAATLLLDRSADVNARATVDEAGIGGQTAIFHAVTQSGDDGLPVTELLLQRGADLGLRVKLPGSYERPGEIVECTPLGYALLFGGDRQRKTVALLRECWRCAIGLAIAGIHGGVAAGACIHGADDGPPETVTWRARIAWLVPPMTYSVSPNPANREL